MLGGNLSLLLPCYRNWIPYFFIPFTIIRGKSQAWCPLLKSMGAQPLCLLLLSCTPRKRELAPPLSLSNLVQETKGGNAKFTLHHHYLSKDTKLKVNMKFSFLIVVHYMAWIISSIYTYFFHCAKTTRMIITKSNNNNLVVYCKRFVNLFQHIFVLFINSLNFMISISILSLMLLSACVFTAFNFN
jgi:hypothetical protein